MALLETWRNLAYGEGPGRAEERKNCGLVIFRLRKASMKRSFLTQLR